MKITVVTSNGERYEFYEENDMNIFKNGGLRKGEVIRIRNEPICVGKPIRMDIRVGGKYSFNVMTASVEEIYVNF